MTTPSLRSVKSRRNLPHHPAFDIPNPEERIALSLTDIDRLKQSAKDLPTMGLSMVEIKLTPNWAWRLLRANIRNRTVRWGDVRRFAAAIGRQEWVANGETLKMTVDGWLLDGQHRCCAVILADVPIHVALIIGVDSDCFSTIDVGRARTAGDTFSIMGENKADLLAAALRLLWRAEGGKLLGAGWEAHPTRTQLQDTLERHPTIRESVELASPMFTTIPKSLAVFLHYQLSHVDPEDAQVFCERLATGIGFTNINDPILAARNTIAKLKKSDRGTMIWVLYRAWNAFRQGKDVTRYNFNNWDRKTWPKLR